MDSPSFSGRDFLPAKKLRRPPGGDPRAHLRAFLCMCAFVILILLLLHCSSNMDYIPPSPHHPIQGTFSMSNVGNPPFHYHQASPSFFLSTGAGIRAPACLSRSPLLNSAKSRSLRMLYARKSSPSAAINDVGGASNSLASRTALQGLGTLFVRGSIAVSELAVAHVEDGTSVAEFRMFLRAFHRSGMSASSDLVFLFASDALLVVMEHVILQEHTYLCRLLSQNQASNLTIRDDENVYANSTISPFRYRAFGTTAAHNSPIWGRGPLNSANSGMQKEFGDGSLEFGFGSVVGFDVSEVDPDNSLQGFIDNPPLALRRWPAYQMLLGMAKHEFKQVLLTAVRGVCILGDPLAMARRKAGLFFSLTDDHWGSTHISVEADDMEGKRRSHEGYNNMTQDIAAHATPMLSHARLRLNSENEYKESPKHSTGTMHKHRKKYMPRRSRSNQNRKPQNEAGNGVGLYERVYGSTMWNMLDDEGKNKRLVNSAVIAGDVRHVRGVANAMAIEIVKVALQRGSRGTFPDDVLLSHIVHNGNEGVLGKRVLEHLHVLDNSASFVHSLMGSHPASPFLRMRSRQKHPMISCGLCNSRIWNHVVALIHRDICSSSVDAEIYNDCL